MSKITLGTWSDGKPVRLDIGRFIESRGLIQAESGGGKSWALRGCLEVTHGHVQQIVIDPEGEFSSLREKFDLIIAAAHDGDALAHPKTARLLAIRLLETEASAVLDLYDLKVHERHAFVRIFLEALIEAPKKLWHPVLVAIDEAHIFCPEKGQGESEAAAAVIDLSSRGRKRGLAMLGATQRIGMFHKSAAANLKNKLIGSTGLDVDVKRAAFELGLAPKDALVQLRALEPGHFYAFGPAFGQVEPREMVTGSVQTTHPKVGHRAVMKPPQPSEAIKALLPQLADLPQEAEAELRTIEDLKRELANTRRELTQAKRAQPAVAPAAKVDHAARRQDAATIARLERALEEAMKFIVEINARDFVAKTGESVDAQALEKAIASAVGQAMKLIEAGQAARNRDLLGLKQQAAKLIERVNRLRQDNKLKVAVEVRHNEPFTVAPAPKPAKPERPRPTVEAGGDGSIAGLQKRILDALAWLDDKGIEPASREATAAVARVKPGGGYYTNSLGALRTANLVDYPSPGMVCLTEEGRALAHVTDDGSELHEKWLGILSGLERQILSTLIEKHPEELSRETLGEMLSKEPGGGYFTNTLGRLRTLGAIDYPQPGYVALTKAVMP